jgi:hypothetical protein
VRCVPPYRAGRGVTPGRRTRSPPPLFLTLLQRRKGEGPPPPPPHTNGALPLPACVDANDGADGGIAAQARQPEQGTGVGAKWVSCGGGGGGPCNSHCIPRRRRNARAQRQRPMHPAHPQKQKQGALPPVPFKNRGRSRWQRPRTPPAHSHTAEQQRTCANHNPARRGWRRANHHAGHRPGGHRPRRQRRLRWRHGQPGRHRRAGPQGLPVAVQAATDADEGAKRRQHRAATGDTGVTRGCGGDGAPGRRPLAHTSIETDS